MKALIDQLDASWAEYQTYVERFTPNDAKKIYLENKIFKKHVVIGLEIERKFPPPRVSYLKKKNRINKVIYLKANLQVIKKIYKRLE